MLKLLPDAQLFKLDIAGSIPVARSNSLVKLRISQKRCPLRGLTEEMKLDYIPSNKSLIGARGVSL